MNTLLVNARRPRSIMLFLMALTAVAVALFNSTVIASASDDEWRQPVQGLTVSPGDSAGELRVVWDAHPEGPVDYRVTWTPAGASYRSYTQSAWNAFPTEPELTVSGLTPGADFKVKVRARFTESRKSRWSDSVNGTVAEDSPGNLIRLLDQEPVIAQQQVAAPATMDECKQGLVAGHFVFCAGNDFSFHAVEPDGSYYINWSEWATRQSNVSHYSIQRLQFMYRLDFEQDGNPVDPTDFAPLGADSCRPSYYNEAWFWSCKGISNVREDPDGNPTSVTQLESNYQGTSYSGRLSAPGRKRNVEIEVLVIPARLPTGLADRLTEEELGDTVFLTVTEVEMHLYLNTVHFDDDSTESHYDLVDGASGLEDRA